MSLLLSDQEIKFVSLAWLCVYWHITHWLINVLIYELILGHRAAVCANITNYR